MKKHSFLTLFIILLLIAAMVTGIYRGIMKEAESRNAGQQQPPATQAASDTQQPAPPPGDQGTDIPQPPAPPQEQPVAEPPAPTERPHSVEHAEALRLAQVLQMPEQQKQEAVQELVQKEGLSQESQQAIQEWTPGEEKVTVQEVGTILPEQGTDGKKTRYRLSTESGQDHLLVTVETPAQGKPRVVSVQKVSADKTQVDAQSDAISVVEGFLESLAHGDMNAARALVSGTEVSDATLAGLCMMFEEGDLKLRGQIPLRNVLMNEENAGFLVYLSPKEGSGTAGNVGVELTRVENKGWRVKAVALDNILAHYEQTAAKEGGVYFPIVKNPHGGDSLVLHFGFDDATLSPRSQSQLKIVAQLLVKSNGKLNISGHTDDVGSASYNLDLSQRRAEAVRQTLISHGVPAEHITTRGMGKSQPHRSFKAGDSSSTISTIRSENRRAEIYLDF